MLLRQLRQALLATTFLRVTHRMQRHMHPLNPTTEERTPLRSCLSTKGGEDCKHEFPKTACVTDEPFIVCDGIARERGLPLNANRGLLGCTLGRRACENKCGTSNAFSAGSPWCNNCVSPDLRVPRLAETHEPRCTCACVGRL